MRVLHINDNAGFFGGVEQVVHDIARGLSEKKWEQGVLFTEGGSESTYMGPFSWSGMCPEEAISDFEPDVAIFHKVKSASVVEKISRSVPGIYMVHDHDILCPRRHKYFPVNEKICTRPAGISCVTNLCFIERAASDQLIPVKLFDGVKRQRNDLAAAKNIRQFISGSRWMSDELAMNGIARDKINIIAPVPYSIDQVKPIPATDGTELLFVGQLIRGKGVDLLLEAVASLKQDWSLTIVGQGRQEGEFRKLAAKLGISHKVRFTGWVDHDQLDSFYTQSQIVVVPSRWPEPFGMVGIEAMVRGRPVVGFAAGGIEDWLSDGTNGLLAKPGDAKDLAKKIATLLNDDELRVKLGNQAHQHVQAHFTHQKFIVEMTKIIEGVRE